MKLSDITDAPAQKLRLSDVTAQAPVIASVTAPPDPTEGMSTWDKLRAGIGKGMTDANLGAQQFIAHNPAIAGIMGLPSGLTDPGYVKAVDAAVDEKERLDAPLAATPQGKWGGVVGNLAATAPLGGAGKAVEGLGLLGKILSAARAGAVTGGIGSMLQPVQDVGDKQVGDLVTGQQHNDFAAAKLKQIAEGVATGAATGGALSGVGSALKGVLNARTLPFRMMAGDSVVDAAQAGAQPSRLSDYITRSEQVAKDTGVPLTPGQVTGSKGLMTMEQAVRQSPSTADAIFAHDQGATQALDDYVSRMLSNTSASARSPEETGDLVRKALQSKIGDLTKQRATLADQQYGEIRAMAAGRPLIEPDNLRAALSDIASEQNAIGTPAAESLSKFAEKQLGSELGNVDGILGLRSYLSRVAGGQAKIGGEGYDRSVAKKLLDSIDADLDANADRLGGPIGDKLRTANANYRNLSQQIDYVKQSPLGKLLGEDVTNGMQPGAYNTIAPEKILARVQRMTPSEVSQTRAMMQDASPETWAALKRSVIEDALEKARVAAPSQGANTLAMQPTAFVRALNGQTPQGQAWANAMLEPNEMAQLRNAYDAALRLGDKTGFNFSGTAAQQEANKLTDAARHPIGAASSAIVNMLTSKRLAAAMVDPNGRKALLQLRDVPLSSDRARQLLAQLAAVTVTQQQDQPNAGGDGQ